MSVAERAAEVSDREIERLIYRASVRLDVKDFKGWLDLCAEQFDYSIDAYSHEIRKRMTWLHHDRDGMLNLAKMLPRHNTDQADFTRHTTVYSVDRLDDGTAAVLSAVTIYRTTLDGGVTSIFAVGKYHDTVDVSSGVPLFASRRVELTTRALGIGTHYPL
jgi:methanesulfonate monooxygenase small subunit